MVVQNCRAIDGDPNCSISPAAHSPTIGSAEAAEPQMVFRPPSSKKAYILPNFDVLHGGTRSNFLESVQRMYRIDCVQICRSGGSLFGEHRASLTTCTGDDLSACSRSALRSLTVHIELTLLASFYPFLADLKTSQACRSCANQSCWHSIVQPEQRDAVLVLGVLIQEAARAPVKAA